MDIRLHVPIGGPAGVPYEAIEGPPIDHPVLLFHMYFRPTDIRL
jgi:hypothetical protein